MNNIKLASQKRFYNRTNVTLKVNIFYGDMFYSGVITNISGNGMFIRTRKSLPSKSAFAIIIDIEEEYLNVFASVKRVVKGDGYQDGIGVEILNDKQEYLQFVKNLASYSLTSPSE